MAKAPTPGVGKQRAAEAAAARVLKMKLRDETLEFCPDNLPFGERIAVRKATTLGYESFWGGTEVTVIDLDAFRVLWWLAKRANGDRSYQFAEAIADVALAIESDEFDLELTSLDAPEQGTDNPES